MTAAITMSEAMASLNAKEADQLDEKFGTLPDDQFEAAVIRFVLEKRNANNRPDAQDIQGGEETGREEARAPETAGAQGEVDGQGNETSASGVATERRPDTGTPNGADAGERAHTKSTGESRSPSRADAETQGYPAARNDVRGNSGAVETGGEQGNQDSPVLVLAPQSPADIAAANEKARADEARAKSEAAAKSAAEKAETERKAIAEASTKAADDFSLTSTATVDKATQKKADAKAATDQLAGQNDIFSKPANTLSVADALRLAAAKMDERDAPKVEAPGAPAVDAGQDQGRLRTQSGGAMGRFATLRGKSTGADQAVADAERVTGLILDIPVESTDDPSRKGSPMHFDMKRRVIVVNTAAAVFGRSLPTRFTQ